MKLFLSSMSVAPQHQKEFINLVGKDPSDIQIAFIPNAAEPYREERRGFVKRDYDMLVATGAKVQSFDLNAERGCDLRAGDIYVALEKYDVIWLGGGNTFWLRYILNVRCADWAIRKLLKQGVVIGGGSAGAIIAGPTIIEYAPIDTPHAAPKLFNDGLGLTKYTVIPHWGDERHQELNDKVYESLNAKNYDIITLTDDQAVIIQGETPVVLS